MDEQIVFSQLSKDENAVFALLVASGYLKVVKARWDMEEELPLCQLAITNFEVKCMFRNLISGWFRRDVPFHEFVRAMFQGDEEEMNLYMNDVALATFSYFDTGNAPSESKNPERFYHGFVLGLLVDRADGYLVKSNRESGYGRYDVVLEPKNVKDTAVIMEFKVFREGKLEKTLEDTAKQALRQIEEKKYEEDLLQRGISEEHILKYGFAFQGEKCLIRKG